MSLFSFNYNQPHLRRDWFNQGGGFGLTPEDYIAIVTLPQTRRDYRPWANLRAAQNVGSTIKEDKDKFQINLDVQHFAPEEIEVKTVDGHLVVEAKHDDRQDEHGFISRSFTRRIPLPEGIDPDSVISRLSSDGVLTVTAPLKPQPKGSDERIVPIIQTGPVKKQEDSSNNIIKEE